jgi:hypothetical protein
MSGLVSYLDEDDEKQVKISIQPVNEKGEPLGHEIIVPAYGTEIGIVDMGDIIRIKPLQYEKVIRDSDNKNISPVYPVLARTSDDKITEIPNVVSRYIVNSPNTDSKSGHYIEVRSKGDAVIIKYVGKGAIPIKVKVGNNINTYILPEEIKIVLDVREEILIGLPETYAIVREENDGSLIVTKALLEIENLGKEL